MKIGSRSGFRGLAVRVFVTSAGLLVNGCGPSSTAPDGAHTGGEQVGAQTQALAASAAPHGSRVAAAGRPPSAPGANPSPPAPSPGVIVRFKGEPAFETHARERPRGLSPAIAAASAQRAKLRLQHTRILNTLRGQLGTLVSRRGHGKVVGKSFDDFTDVINGIALYGVDEIAARHFLQNEPDLLSIEPIGEVHATLPESVPLIEANKVWAVPDANGIGIDGTGTRVGIVDTGVDYTHPDLGGCFGPGCKVVAGYDFVNQKADPMDDNGHGTHVAATAAGRGTYLAADGGTLPIPGVAPGAEIYAYKVLDASGSGSATDIIAAIEQCADPNGDGNPEDHLDVCNLSLGGAGTPDDAESTAVDTATANGVVFAIAAGNGGPNASTIGSPGTSRRAITVAAACKTSAIGVDSRCSTPIASFSSRGPVVWTTASGTQTLAKPDVAAPGVNICAAEHGTFDSADRCLDGSHIALSGTSMASPHIAGVVALLRQAHPEWTPDQVKTFIVSSARNLGLDPTIQGSGMVDALDALELGGLPTSIVTLSGTPLRDVDVPTSRFGTFASNLTVTNTTTSSLTFTGSFAGDTGLTVTLAPTALTLAPGASGSILVTRQVDHDVVASGVSARGTITLSSPQGNVKVGVEVGVRDRLTAAPSPADLGVDLPTQSTWTGQTTIQLTNVRTDEPGTYTASIACCNSVTQAGGGSIVASLDQSSVTVAPGGTTTLGVTVTATNATLVNDHFTGTVTLASSLGTITVPVTFFKGYGIRVDTATIPQSLTLSSAQTGSTTFPVVQPSTTFYSATPGPFFAEAVWPFGLTHQHALAVVNTTVPLAVVALDPSQATYSYTIAPRDAAGQPLAGALLMYRFTHSATGGGALTSGSFYGDTPIYVSAVPAGVNFTAALVTTVPEPLGYLYELAGPTSANQVFTNAASDLVARDVRVFRPGVGTDPIFFQPEACLPWLPYGLPTPGAAISGVRHFCGGGGGVPLLSGVGQMLFYNSSNRDLLAAPYPDAPSISYELLDGSAAGNTLYRGPDLYVSATHPLSWSMIAPWTGTVSAGGAYARFACDDAPGGVLAVGPSPMRDQWSWWNHRTDFSAVQGSRGAFENPFEWGGCLQDDDFSTTPVSYRLFRDGAPVQSATMSSDFPVTPTLADDGQYRFEMSRSPVVAGVSTQVETVSTFCTASLASIDENPPALRSLHLLGRSLWQDVLDPAVVNRLRFNVDPMPGFADASATPPPLFTSLLDGLASVTAQQGPDGHTWKDIPTTVQSNGDYLTDVIDVDPAAAVTWFRLLATDLAGNTLTYSFELPSGASYASTGADVTPPTTAITSPDAGAVLTGTTTVTAVAADNVGVTGVDLLVDGTKVATSTSAPYSFMVSAGLFTTGPHQLQTRAADAAENVGYSPAVAVSVQNADVVPPTVSIAAPVDGSAVRKTIVILASASDDNAVTHVDFYDGATMLGTTSAAPYALTWSTASATGGAHTLRAVAFDAAGNSASATVNVVVDNTLPTVALTQPLQGSTVGGVVQLGAAASDNVAVARVDFYDSGTLLGSATAAPYTVSWDTTLAALGTHTLHAHAYDTAGNAADSAVVVTVSEDVTPPTVAITAPTEGAVVGRYLNVLINATDNVGVSSVAFYDGTTLVRQFANQLPPYGFAWDDSSVADGPHTLTAQAIDAAGNIGTSSPVHVTFDKVPPTASVITPLNNATVSGVIQLQAAAADNVGLASVAFDLQDTVLATRTAPPFTFSWNTTGIPDGWVTLSALATDLAGNQTLASIFLLVNNTVAVTLTSPTSGALVGPTVPITAATNDDAAVASIAFFDGTTAIGSVTGPPFALTWHPAAGGAHSLTAKAADKQGRVTTSPAVSVTADITPPTVALTAPINGATVNGTVQLTATATDNVAVAHVDFYDGSSLVATSSAAPYHVSWNTAAVPTGAHTLMARAYDTAGNTTASATVTVTVNRAQPALFINAGGPLVSPYLADEDFAGGSTIDHADTINVSGVTNPAPQAAYQDARTGSFTYTLPGFTPGSSHQVRLHFAETYFTKKGARTFNVSINGTRVLSAFDIFAAAGAKDKAVVEAFTATADASGRLTITFAIVVNSGLVSAVEVE